MNAKKTAIIITVILVVVLVAVLIKKIFFNCQPGKVFTKTDAENGLKAVAAKYGKERATIVEKITRLETAHYTSGQFKACGTGGMEAHGSAPFYGWHKPFFLKNPSYKPCGTWQGKEGLTGATKTFVVMPSVEAYMMYLADYISRYNGNYARWYSTDAAKQAYYENSLANIQASTVNNFA